MLFLSQGMQFCNFCYSKLKTIFLSKHFRSHAWPSESRSRNGSGGLSHYFCIAVKSGSLQPLSTTSQPLQMSIFNFISSILFIHTPTVTILWHQNKQYIAYQPLFKTQRNHRINIHVRANGSTRRQSKSVYNIQHSIRNTSLIEKGKKKTLK